MKAILEFNLPDDEQAHRDALAGSEYCAAILAVDRLFRDELKYKSNSEAVIKLCEALRAFLRENAPRAFDDP